MSKFKVGDKVVCPKKHPGATFTVVATGGNPSMDLITVRSDRIGSQMMVLADEFEYDTTQHHDPNQLEFDFEIEELEPFEIDNEEYGSNCDRGIHMRSDHPMQLAETGFKWYYVCKDCGTLMGEFQ